MRRLVVVAMLTACAAGPRSAVLISCPERDVELPGVADEDILVAAVRVLAAFGLAAPAAGDGLAGDGPSSLVPDQGDHWRADGVIVTHWIDVEPVHNERASTVGAPPMAIDTVLRRHSFRVAARESTLTFAVDCIDRGAAEKVWRPCAGDLRNVSFAARAQEMLDRIVAEAKRRSGRKRGP